MNVRLYHSMDDDDANWCEAEQNRISRPASRMHNIISLIPEHVRQAHLPDTVVLPTLSLELHLNSGSLLKRQPRKNLSLKKQNIRLQFPPKFSGVFHSMKNHHHVTRFEHDRPFLTVTLNFCLRINTHIY